MEGCPAGDAGTVLNTVGGLTAQGFDYAILPPIFFNGGCYVTAKRKVSKKFLIMSDVYRIFSRQWEHMMNYDQDSLVEMFNYESHGTPITDPRRNGYFVGKQWMDVHIKMWREDIEKGYLTRQELYDDPTFPNWWLDKVLPLSSNG